MNPRTIGWSLVAVQFVLLIALVFLPSRDDWPTPLGVELAGWILIALGAAIALLASRDLGGALTPTPEPLAGHELRTDGMYRFARHPIYSGILVATVGIVVRSGSWLVFAIGVAAVVFFNAKAAWEERRLAMVYPDYPAYAERVGRFGPKR